MHKTIFVLHDPAGKRTHIVSGAEAIDTCKKHQDFVLGAGQKEPHAVIGCLIDSLDSDGFDLENPEHARRAVERLNELKGSIPNADICHVGHGPESHYPDELRVAKFAINDIAFVSGLRGSVQELRGEPRHSTQKRMERPQRADPVALPPRTVDVDAMAKLTRLLPKSLVIKSDTRRLYGYHGGTGKLLFVVNPENDKGSVSKVLDVLSKHGFASIMSDSSHKCALAAKEKMGIELRVLGPDEILHLKDNVNSFRDLWTGGARNKPKSFVQRR